MMKKMRKTALLLACVTMVGAFSGCSENKEVAEGEKIKITMKTPTQAITIEPYEKEEEFEYFYMILPVRMNEK